MKVQKIIYYAATGILSLLMLFSAGMMLMNAEGVSENFERLGYPSYLRIFIGIAKPLGLVAIWSNYSRTLKEWAYAGFFFNFVLALSAHLTVGDGEWPGAAVALGLLTVSYVLNRKIYG